MRYVSPIALATILWATSALALDVPESWLAEWPRTDFSRTAVAFAEIRSGGPPRDGIPSIDVPMFVSVAEAAKILGATEAVLSVVIDGQARAYPLRILMWHEIVNDTLAGVPIAVTYCPLCNSGIVFERRVAGDTTTFGTTGKLRNSDLVMYDRASESWWQQFEGRAIIGTRLGDELARVPARLEGFALFAERHPEGRVLAAANPRFRDYGRNPYAGYDSAPRPFLFDGRYDGPGEPLMRVVAVHGLDRAWSMTLIRHEREVRHEDLVIEWSPGQASALDAARVGEGREIGNITVQRVVADGARADVVYDVPFAFAYRAFHPGVPILHVEPVR